MTLRPSIRAVALAVPFLMIVLAGCGSDDVEMKGTPAEIYKEKMQRRHDPDDLQKPAQSRSSRKLKS
jgi:hypothetical protein